MNQSQLQILLTLKDEATASLKGFADQTKTSMADIGVTMAKTGGIMTAVGGAILAPLYASVKAAADAQDQMNIFTSVLNNIPSATAEVRSQLLATAEGFEKLGFDNDQTELALARFYQRTKDVAEATRLTSDALDLARFKHEDLETAITQVNMVLSGQGRILSQVGINLKEAGGGLNAMKELEGVIGGTALNATKDFNVQMDIMKVEVGNVAKQIGAVLLPILGDIVKAIEPVIENTIKWIEGHKQLTKIIVVAAAIIGTLLVVFGTLAVLLGGLITLFSSVAGVIAAGVIAAITGLVVVAGIVISNWQAVSDFFVKFWADMKSGWQAVIEYVVGLWDSLLQKIQQVASAIANSAVGKAAGAIGNAGSAAIQGLTNFGHVLGFAQGGIVSSPTLAVVGEAGPEAIVPLSGLGTGGIGGGSAINVYLSGNFTTDEQNAKNIGNMIARAINQQLKLKSY